MRHAFFVSAALVAATCVSLRASTPQFADSVPAGGYVRGTTIIGTGPSVNADPAAALGPVDPIVGPGAFQSLYNPFSPHFESSALVAFGLGGSLTVKFASPVAVVGTPQIGVFTNVGFVDQNFPSGETGPSTMTFAGLEYGAERSAIVEVGSTPFDFHSLGRVVFSAPGNYYANLTDPTAAIAPPDAIPADFGKPFTQPLSSFDNKDFAGVISVLDGSAGGTWITVPTDIGIPDIEFIRFSSPLWVLPDGSTAELRTSLFNPALVKPADLFVDAVALIPEPGTAGLMLVMMTFAAARRIRKA